MYTTHQSSTVSVFFMTTMTSPFRKPKSPAYSVKDNSISDAVSSERMKSALTCLLRVEVVQRNSSYDTDFQRGAQPSLD